MKRLLIIPMLLVSSVVGACESYEECMEDWQVKTHTIDGKPVNWKQSSTEKDTLKAIAYKLDEISKKLEPPMPKVSYYKSCENWAQAYGLPLKTCWSKDATVKYGSSGSVFNKKFFSLIDDGEYYLLSAK